MVEITTDEDWFCLGVRNSLIEPSDILNYIYTKQPRFHLNRFIHAINECSVYVSTAKCVRLSGIISRDDVLKELHNIDATVPVVCRSAIPDLITDYSTLWLIDQDDAILFNRLTFCNCISMLVHYERKYSIDKVIIILQ